MQVKDLKQVKEFVFVNEGNLEDNIDDVFVGDLLSWVMASANINSAWITVQAHINTVAVSLLKEFSCLIICDNADIEQETIDKCIEENFCLIKTELNAYQCCKEFYKLGL